MTRRSQFLGLVAAASLLVLPACGDDSSKSSSDTAAAASAPVVSQAWARTSPAGVTDGVIYATITGGKAADVLTGVTVDSSVAASTMMHTTMSSTATSMDDMGTMPASNASTTDPAAGDGDTMGTMPASNASTTEVPTMTMEPIDHIEIPAGKTVKLESGGYHIMLMGLAKPLKAGDTFEATFMFKTAGANKVTVEVKDEP